MAGHLSVAFVLLQMLRIRVSWTRCATTHAFSFSPYLRLSAPLLQSFHFEICPCPTDDVLIDREVFGKVGPDNLRHVHLDGCAVQLSSPIFHGLTQLSLCNTLRSHPRWTPCLLFSTCLICRRWSCIGLWATKTTWVVHLAFFFPNWPVYLSLATFIASLISSPIYCFVYTRQHRVWLA